MLRLLIVWGFSALLFLSGILAGRAVYSVSDTSYDSKVRSSGRAARSELIPADLAQPDAPRVPFMTVSSENLTNDNAFDSHSAGTGVENQLGTAEAELSVNPPDSQGHRNVLALIHSIFPSVEPDTAEIWAGVYADMDPAEVAFILEQKRQLSGSLAAGSSEALSETSLAPNHEGPFVESSTQVAVAVNAVRNNLRGAWSVGFRRTVVLPEVMAPRELNSGDVRQPMRLTMFPCFDPGRTISSPIATHVALPASDGSLMFLLEGNRLTRRGDFELLSDRRLGLITQSGTYAIANSLAIPDTASAIRVTAAGEICYDNKSGEPETAGRVPVRRIVDLTKLKSNDGVIFSCESADPELTAVNAMAELMTNRLEISSVDCDEESLLLEQLNLLCE